MKRFAILGLAVALASSTAGASFAQGGPDAAPGDARRQCMMAHKDQLSDACKSAIAAAMAARRAAGQTSSAPHN